jgi:hypothetical protein
MNRSLILILVATAALFGCAKSKINMDMKSEIGALLIKTGVGHSVEWDALVSAARSPEDPFVASFEVVNDAKFEGKSHLEVSQMLSADAGVMLMLIADEQALTNDGFPCIVLDVLVGPESTFRATAVNLASIENNLSIANMGFEEFQDAADKDGIFRGF